MKRTELTQTLMLYADELSKIKDREAIIIYSTVFRRIYFNIENNYSNEFDYTFNYNTSEADYDTEEGIEAINTYIVSLKLKEDNINKNQVTC